MKKRNYLLAALLTWCLIKLDMVDRFPAAFDYYLSGRMARRISHLPQKHAYIVHNVPTDMWMMNGLTPTERRQHENPEFPAERRMVFSIRKDLFAEKRQQLLAGSLLAVPRTSRRFVCINVEQTILDLTKESDVQYRGWPHLGLLYVGTIAQEEGYDVVLWDELIQGRAPLEQLIQEGDLVGLSLVVTGMEKGRGLALAREAKKLGARYCVAGNDSAIFRANQILSIPDKPIDAVITADALLPLRLFFRHIRTSPFDELCITGVQTKPGMPGRSNEREWLMQEREARRAASASDENVFTVPNLSLYPMSYWERVWSNYRRWFGHKYEHPELARNALALFAQGCTRTRGTAVCLHCTITGVANIQMPSHDYLVKTVEAYQALGINTVFNVTDSSFEMAAVPKRLKEIGASWPALMIYGRAQGIANSPKLIEVWRSVGDYLRINVGMESADETILQNDHKSSHAVMSDAKANRLTVKYLKEFGAHLHVSFIFGTPGETRDSCERTVAFVEWMAGELGPLLDFYESDIFWLNFGAPAALVFHDYAFAQELAAQAGKSISEIDWHEHFARFSEELVVPWEVEKDWYRFFTRIDLETAQEYNARVATRMAKHTGSIRGRAFKPAV